MPDHAMPGGAVPGDAVPDDAETRDAMPEGAVPGDAAPDTAMRGDPVPDGAMRDDPMPESAVPGNGMPEHVMPVDPLPAELVARRRREWKRDAGRGPGREVRRSGMQSRPNRRRFLAITAAAAGVGTGVAASPGAGLHVWNGTALGARASLRLYHPERRVAEAATLRAVAEIRRLERVFSLYRPDSALSALNRDGVLSAPPLDLVRILGEAQAHHRATGGVFDVTVQPLWRLHAAHFATGATAPPERAEIEAALALVGQEKVTIGAGRIAFARPGMAITLNGIAQGYITDRVAEGLRQAGFADVLVDLGEARAMGRHADGTPWRAALAEPGGTAPLHEVELRDRALATSAPGGFAFDGEGRVHHIFDPRSGRPSAAHSSVSVLAPEATAADALSTAFVQMPAAMIRRVIEAERGISVHLLNAQGDRDAFGSQDA